MNQLNLQNATENEILYEINEESIISIQEDDCLMICSFYLPTVIQLHADANFSSKVFEYTFNLHITNVLSEVCCQKRWYGIPLIFDEEYNPIKSLNQQQQNQLREYLWRTHGQIPIFIDEHDLNYFNNEFCAKIFYPIMNNDVSMKQLSSLTYTNEMYDSFKLINHLFQQVIQQDIDRYDQKQLMLLVQDYRLLFTASNLAHRYFRLPVTLFYNRYFPHLELLKLIPFYKQILNSFLQLNLICFSNYNTAQSFLTIIKQLYGLDYQSQKAAFSFKYLGRLV